MKIGMGVRTIVSAGWNMDGIGRYTEQLSKSVGCQHHDIAPYYTEIPSTLYHQFVSSKLDHQLKKRFSNLKFCPYLPRIPLPSFFSRRIDVYHATDYFCPRFMDKTPVVATLHDAIPFKHPEWVKQDSKIQQKTHDKMKKRLLRSIQHVNHVIAVSDAMVEDIVNYWGVKKENISVVHSGVSRAWFKPINDADINQVLAQFKLSPGFLLCVGTLQPRKNIGRIIAAFEHVSNGFSSQL